MSDGIVLALRVTIVLLFLLALWKGAGPEKIAMGTMFAMLVLDLLYHSILPGGRNYSSIDLGHFVQDLIGLSGFVFLTLRADRLYPICMLGAQIFVMVSHLDRELVTAIPDLVYAWLIRLPSYLQVAAAATGLFLHIRRTMRVGPYRSWRNSFAQS